MKKDNQRYSRFIRKVSGNRGDVLVGFACAACLIGLLVREVLLNL